MVFTQQDKTDLTALHTKKKNDKQFIKSLLSHLKKKYTNDTTLSSKISLYKKYVRDNNLLDKPEDNLKLIGDDKLRRKLNKAREDRQEAPKKKLNKSVVNKIIDFKTETNSDKLLIFLLFATGRRITEFINGNWTVRGNKLFIDKISKKRGDNHPAGGYEIRLINKVKPAEFITLLNKFKTGNNRPSSEANRKVVNRLLKKPEFAPINKVKDLRPLYVQYLKDYDSEIKQLNGNQAIKNILHHNKKTTSILYNDKFDIVKTISDADFKKMRKPTLKQLLIANGINRGNTKRFNTLKKPELIALIKKNKISKK